MPRSECFWQMRLQKVQSNVLKNFVVDSHFTQFDERVVIYRRFVDVVQTAVIYLLCVCTCDGDIVLVPSVLYPSKMMVPSRFSVLLLTP